MIKILIVDDEIYVGKLIYDLIDWTSLDAECVDITQNGNEAYVNAK